MKYSFLDLAEEVLLTAEMPLTVNEIWDKAVKTKLSEKLASSGKTPWQTLGARIYMDLKDNTDTKFVQISKRPAKFYLKSLNPTDIKINLRDAPVEEIPICKFNERDLHVLLSTFVLSNPHFKCFTKTIYHELSKKRKTGYNKWLHPDLVGIYFPFDEFQHNTLRLLETLKENPYKIFAFEMKIEINFSNLREYYFQAVSNSSWAHEGYLVTLRLEDDPLLMDELRRLNNMFGIGIIRLDPVNIEQSEILFAAKATEFLDWETIDRLTEENPDFKDFIEDLMEDIKIGKVKSNYDETLSADTFEEYVKSKGIV